MNGTGVQPGLPHARKSPARRVRVPLGSGSATNASPCAFSKPFARVIDMAAQTVFPVDHSLVQSCPDGVGREVWEPGWLAR